MLVKVIGEPLINIMLDFPPHLSNLIIENGYHFQIRGLEFRALIADCAVGLDQRSVRILNSVLALVKGLEGLRIVILGELLNLLFIKLGVLFTRHHQSIV